MLFCEKIVVGKWRKSKFLRSFIVHQHHHTSHCIRVQIRTYIRILFVNRLYIFFGIWWWWWNSRNSMFVNVFDLRMEMARNMVRNRKEKWSDHSIYDKIVSFPVFSSSENSLKALLFATVASAMNVSNQFVLKMEKLGKKHSKIGSSSLMPLTKVQIKIITDV